MTKYTHKKNFYIRICMLYNYLPAQQSIVKLGASHRSKKKQKKPPDEK